VYAAAATATARRDDDTEAGWVVYLSGIRWGWHANRQQELARQLAQTRRVLFVEPPGLTPSWRLRVERLAPALWRAMPPTLLPFGRFVPPVNRVNRRVAAWTLRRWLAGHPGPRVLWIDEDLAAPVIGRLGETACVYDAADLDWTFTRRWNRGHLRRALDAAVAGADLVLVSSPALADVVAHNGARPVELVNACDPDHFTPDGPVADVLAGIPGPRLGYIGSIDERAFDGPLVASVARLRPDWSFVLVGGATPAGLRALDGLPNVHLLGPMEYARVPSFLRGVDVCLIPYRTDGRARYVHPKKLYEYLAVGKPVVSTPLPSLAASDAPHRSAETPEDFASAIDAALAEAGSPELAARRRAVASANTWDARGSTLRGLVDVLDDKTRNPVTPLTDRRDAA
jgi:glycosyltransferase involved in cell wall biosynthesis